MLDCAENSAVTVLLLTSVRVQIVRMQNDNSPKRSKAQLCMCRGLPFGTFPRLALELSARTSLVQRSPLRQVNNTYSYTYIHVYIIIGILWLVPAAWKSRALKIRSPRDREIAICGEDRSCCFGDYFLGKS